MKPASFGHREGFEKTEEGAAVIKDLREKYVRDRLPVHFKQISDQLKSSGGPFLFGADLTMADIWFLPRIRYLQKGIISCVHFYEKHNFEFKIKIY